MSSRCIRAIYIAVLVGFSMAASVQADAASTEPTLLARAEVAQAEQDNKEAKPKKEKRECRRVRQTGSRIASRVCKKPSEWARINESSQEAVRRSVDGSNRNTGSVTSE